MLLAIELQSQTGLTGTIIRILVNAAALFAAAWMLRGIHLREFTQALIAAVILAVFNATLGPLLDVLTLPFTILTLGLFSLVVDALILWLTSKLLSGFEITSFGWAVLMAVLLAIFNVFLHAIYL